MESDRMPETSREPEPLGGDFRMDVERNDAEGTVTLIADLDIDADVEAVWQAISEGEEIARWFAPQAKSQPGEGGSIWMSWDGSYEGELLIRKWLPNQHLQTSWRVKPPDGEAVELLVDYHLEGRGGGTRLRLVHSGFHSTEDWDDIVDSHRRGWAVELRSLRHYVENHRGRSRGMVKIEQQVSCTREEAWRRLLNPPGWLSEGTLDLAEGERFTARTVSGESLEGAVLMSEEPMDLALSVDSMDKGFLRLQLECWDNDPDECLRLRLWFSSWRMSDQDRDRLYEAWSSLLEVLFSEDDAVVSS